MLPVQCIAMIFPFYDNHTFANHLHQQNWRAGVFADKFKGCASANHRFHFHFHFHSHFHFLSMINDQQNWRTDDKFKGCANVQAPIIGIHSLAKCNRALRPPSLSLLFLLFTWIGFFELNPLVVHFTLCEGTQRRVGSWFTMKNLHRPLQFHFSNISHRSIRLYNARKILILRIFQDLCNWFEPGWVVKGWSVEAEL